MGARRTVDFELISCKVENKKGKVDLGKKLWKVKGGDKVLNRYEGRKRRQRLPK